VSVLFASIVQLFSKSAFCTWKDLSGLCLQAIKSQVLSEKKVDTRGLVVKIEKDLAGSIN
jgi:hypothetical protein